MLENYSYFVSCTWLFGEICCFKN